MRHKKRLTRVVKNQRNRRFDPDAYLKSIIAAHFYPEPVRHSDVELMLKQVKNGGKVADVVKNFKESRGKAAESAIFEAIDRL